TAQRGAQHGVVDRDDGLQARVLVVAEDDLLVAVGIQVLEDHSGLRSRRTSSRGARSAAGGVGWFAMCVAGRPERGTQGATAAAFYACPMAIARAPAYGKHAAAQHELEPGV